jgi:hypothetical protein
LLKPILDFAVIVNVKTEYMNWLSHLVHLPIWWDFAIPTTVVIIVALVLSFESYWPLQKKQGLERFKRAH